MKKKEAIGIHVEIPADIHRNLKLATIITGKPMNQIISAALETHLVSMEDKIERVQEAIAC